MSIKISEEIEAYWHQFINQHSELYYLKDFKFEAWSFGNTKEMADELGSLVMEGKKTATCSLARAYQGFEDEIPKVGVYSVLCDGDEKPLCIITLNETFICLYKDITEKHAYEEGEGDRSLAHWKKVHYEFFSSYEGFHDEDTLICERFKVVFK
jgi:uncharacterized protein YhfF